MCASSLSKCWNDDNSTAPSSHGKCSSCIRGFGNCYVRGHPGSDAHHNIVDGLRPQMQQSWANFACCAASSCALNSTGAPLTTMWEDRHSWGWAGVERAPYLVSGGTFGWPCRFTQKVLGERTHTHAHAHLAEHTGTRRSCFESKT